MFVTINVSRCRFQMADCCCCCCGCHWYRCRQRITITKRIMSSCVANNENIQSNSIQILIPMTRHAFYNTIYWLCLSVCRFCSVSFAGKSATPPNATMRRKTKKNYLFTQSYVAPSLAPKSTSDARMQYDTFIFWLWIRRNRNFELFSVACQKHWKQIFFSFSNASLSSLSSMWLTTINENEENKSKYADSTNHMLPHVPSMNEDAKRSEKYFRFFRRWTNSSAENTMRWVAVAAAAVACSEWKCIILLRLIPFHSVLRVALPFRLRL